MSMTAPDWLVKRGGDLRLGSDGCSWMICFEGQPQFRLRPIPVAGKHGCAIEQAVNGKAIESKATYPSVEETVRGGLEELRKSLGW